jgi:pyruvate,water dikinase
VQRYTLKGKSKVITSGRAIGQRIGAGPARIIHDVKEMARVQSGDVLVADMTDPDWEPVMKRAAAIVTNRGGRTCHAAIIARELGIPAVVGCGNATEVIKEGHDITVSCAGATPATSMTASCNSSKKISSSIRCRRFPSRS